MSFNDDDPIVLPPDSRPNPIVPGRVQLVMRSNFKVPMHKNIHKVLLEFSAVENSLWGLDLVVVLDASSSMEGHKLAKMKKAMLFLIKKLRLTDRLSIIEFSSKANKLCPLRQMTESSQREVGNLIIDLKTQSGTNITHGLETALNVLKDRSIRRARAGAIILMSDGEENIGDAATVSVGNVPVHTFGFGNGQVPKVFKDIADNCRLGGTYSDVDMANLSMAFLQCLDGVHSVVAQDLTVSVICNDSIIKQVSTGAYLQSRDYDDRVTIKFGDIYIHQVHKVVVNLLLPHADTKRGANVLKVLYYYKFNEELLEANPVTVNVRRMPGLTTVEQETLLAVRVEEVCLLNAEVIKQAIAEADDEDLVSAQVKLVNVLRMLWDEDMGQFMAKLKATIEELLELMLTQAIYEKQGRPFAYSLLIFFARWCQTGRGNNIGNFELFSTPAMHEFLEETKKLDDYQQYSTDPFTKSFSDDQKIDLPQYSRGVKLEFHNNCKVPLKTNTQKVLLELSTIGTRLSALDIVAVLDVSRSMEGDKLDQMKNALLFVMKKLNSTDRLAIVTYSWRAKRLCPLCQITESSQEKFKNLIKGLKVHPGTNITNGLEIALNVLKDRTVIDGRVSIIMLMSDGLHNYGPCPYNDFGGNVQVHTFGFGEDQNLKVLKDIADNSHLGGYTEVCMDNLDLTFSNCLDELQNRVAPDLTVTVTQIKNESTIRKVSAERYPQIKDNDAGSVTITLGSIYIEEVRNMLVDLLLPDTNEEREANILEVTYEYYSIIGKHFKSEPTPINVLRKSELTEEEQQPPLKVTANEVNLLIVELIKQTTCVANMKELKSVQDKLVRSVKTLGDEHIEQWKEGLKNELDLLRTYLEELSTLVQAEAKNEKPGLFFAYSLPNTHATQHGPATGNNNFGQNQLFTTLAMRDFLEEAKMHPKIHDLQVYMDRFICSIESIEMIIDKV